MDKQAALNAVLQALEREHQTLLASARRTHRAATHEEARPENDKDTRALEASYLARGQAKRVEELAQAMNQLRFFALRRFEPGEQVDVGAVVQLEVDGAPQALTAFLLPVAGGVCVDVESCTIRVVTPAAPLGRRMMGRQEGDEFGVHLGGKVREYLIESVW